MKASVVAVALLSFACSPKDIELVESPGGIYVGDGTCNPATLQAGKAEACPMDSQFSFDAPGMNSNILTTNVTSPNQSCRRSYCGSGSLTSKATLKFKAGAAADQQILVATWLFRLVPEPVDMFGKRLSFHAFVENFSTPLHGQIFVVVDSKWIQVVDGPLKIRDLWNEMGGLVSPSNPLLGMDASVTEIPVAEFVIQIYLPGPVESGDLENWTGDVFIDEIGWK